MTENKTKSWLRRIPVVGPRLAKCFERAPTVAVLRLSGVIGQLGGIRRGGLTLDELAAPIEKAFELPRLKAVALAINSPGGSPVQSALIAGRIRDLAAEKSVPVYAFCEDVAASGGYWLACAADEVYANGASIVGSIGVISAGFGFTGLLEKIGVERRVYSAGERKAQLDPFQPENAKDVRHLKAIQKDLHEQFTEFVRSRRGEKLTGADKTMFSGEFWSGRQAAEMGLVDGIADLRPKMRELFGEKIRLQRVDQPRSWIQRKLRMDGRQVTWARDMVGAVEERGIWSRYGL
ncbi:MAG: S49 family peptidase [Alphaproteobacteria bacterium]|nr:S49 family peptidase [Alphaproteobacteria bacterium]